MPLKAQLVLIVEAEQLYRNVIYTYENKTSCLGRAAPESPSAGF